MIQDMQHAIMYLVVLWIRLFQLLQKSYLDIGIFNFLLHILTNLCGVDFLFGPDICTCYNLAEFALIDRTENLKSIA